MGSFFVVCTVLGGGVLLLQLLLGIFGADGAHDVGHLDLEHDIGHGAGAHDGQGGSGLNLLSVRALAAGIAFFGLAGLAAINAGWPLLLVLAAAVIPGFLAMVLVAISMRWLLGLERDLSIHVSDAIGEGGTVYIPIPGADSGPGRVTLTLNGRTVEYTAVTRGEALSTGTKITVVDIREPDIVEVVATPTLDEVL
jgi:membrane protein implicated in regulation of membrane protease activity